MPTIAVTCTACGNEFEPSGDVIRTGHWHTCPRCRGQPKRTVSGDLTGDPGGAQGRTARRTCLAEMGPPA